MTPTIGKQDKFVDAIKNLIALEYDTKALKACLDGGNLLAFGSSNSHSNCKLFLQV